MAWTKKPLKYKLVVAEFMRGKKKTRVPKTADQMHAEMIAWAKENKVPPFLLEVEYDDGTMEVVTYLAPVLDEKYMVDGEEYTVAVDHPKYIQIFPYEWGTKDSIKAGWLAMDDVVKVSWL